MKQKYKLAIIGAFCGLFLGYIYNEYYFGGGASDSSSFLHYLIYLDPLYWFAVITSGSLQPNLDAGALILGTTTSLWIILYGTLIGYFFGRSQDKLGQPQTPMTKLERIIFSLMILSVVYLFFPDKLSYEIYNWYQAYSLPDLFLITPLLLFIILIAAIIIGAKKFRLNYKYKLMVVISLLAGLYASSLYFPELYYIIVERLS